MSRNRYTKVIREGERDQLAEQERKLEVLRASLKRGDEGSVIPSADDAKHAGSKRRAENKKHKPKHRRDHDDHSS
ncbi:hypothetical protein AB0425_16895 [Actinosynnema sp. NPDC051121]